MDITAVVAAGAASTNIADRIKVVDITINGRDVYVPVAIDQDGEIKVLQSAIDAAERAAPRRAAKFSTDDVGSFCSWVRSYGGSDTRIFVGKSLVVAQIDALAPHSEKGTRNGVQATLSLAHSERLREWISNSKVAMSAERFAELIEAQIDDLASTEIVTAMRNLDVSDVTSFRRVVDDKGRIRLTAEGSQTGTPIPRRFAISVPVFEGDQPSRISFALSMRIAKGVPEFTIRPENLREVVDERRGILCGALGEATGAPCYLGEAP